MPKNPESLQETLPESVDKPRAALMIRFSSMGDIAQCFPAVNYLKNNGFSKIDWLTKPDFAAVPQSHPGVDLVRVFPDERGSGVLGLWRLSAQLQQNYEVIYDAHSSLRSRLLHLFMVLRAFAYLGLKKSPLWITKPSQRLSKWLLWRWRINLFPHDILSPEIPLPQSSRFFLLPLHKFFFKSSNERNKVFTLGRPFLSDLVLEKSAPIALVPSANYDLKKWPLHLWRHLAQSLPQEKFWVLGGPKDLDLKTLESEKNIEVFLGQTLKKSLEVLRQCKAVVGNDTGLTHWSDQAGLKTILLLGPTAFGVSVHSNSRTLWKGLPCQPCSKFGKDSCKISENKACLNRITTQDVISTLKELEVPLL